MIELHAWQTSNCQRVAIVLEECALAYRVHRVDLFKGEQQSPSFLQMNPAGAVPVVVDSDGPNGTPLTLSQSGAIELYLAEKAGEFIPHDPLRRVQALQWLMFAVTDVAPASMSMFLLSMFAPEKSPANVGFFEQRLLRFLRVADGALAERDWLAGELSVADFALYPVYATRKAIVDAAGDLPNLTRWGASLAARPAVAKAMQVATA
jgi:GST-like protein